MPEPQHIIDCYNKTAASYAAKFIDELQHKHLDRMLLSAFAQENRNKGKLIDLGCGPGQTTRFLAEQGLTGITGIDISRQMVQVARQLHSHPHLQFQVADMLHLPFRNHSFAAAIAFYAVVHFNYPQVKKAFEEVNRILTDKGQFLFSFHVGDQTVHLDTFLDHPVNIDFHFLETGKITSLLEETGFEPIDVIERYPYKEIEYPSKRAYIWARKENK